MPMGWLAGLLLVLVFFWILGKLTGKKEFLDIRERIGLNWGTIILIALILLVIFYIALS